MIDQEVKTCVCKEVLQGSSQLYRETRGTDSNSSAQKCIKIHEEAPTMLYWEDA